MTDGPAFARGFHLRQGYGGQAARQARESELELVARLRRRRSAAFDAVHAAFNARLFNFLARLSRRRDVAEDLLEETWLRFVDRAPRFRDDTRLGPLLFTVARNLHISYCRSRSIEDSTRPGPDRFVAVAERRGRRRSRRPSRSETGRRIDDALAALPALYREALLLVAVEDMKPAEAAAVCGISRLKRCGSA